MVVFRPEIFPAGVFHDLPGGDARIPDGAAAARSGQAPPATCAAGSSRAERIDAANFDRIVSFDPLFVEAAADIVPVWRSVPLPVDDSHFAPVQPSAVPPRVLFVGRSTEHREWFLVPVKHASTSST